MGKIYLVTGAARSGKSSFAERMAAATSAEVIYVATAEAFDSEMKERILRHRQSRPSHWITLEEPRDIPAKLAEYVNKPRVILLDCITVWLSNLMLDRLDNQGNLSSSCIQEIEAQVEALISTAAGGKADLVCVSNEVGWSVVPENKLARIFRDLAGRANQSIAKAAAEVYLVVAGYPLEIKGEGNKILSGLEV